MEPAKNEQHLETTVGRLAASLTILALSSATLYAACLRSSNIYFYELESTKVVFMAMPLAVVLPIAISGALVIAYLSHRPRACGVQTSQTDLDDQAYKSTKHQQSPSRRVSSRSTDLKRITEEGDSPETSHTLLVPDARPAGSGCSSRKDTCTMTTPCDSEPRPKFTLASGIPGTEVEGICEEVSAAFASGDESHSRLPSTGSLPEEGTEIVRCNSGAKVMRKASLIRPEPTADDLDQDAVKLFKEIEETSIWTYALGGLDIKVFPLQQQTPRSKPKHSITEVLVDIVATHVPVWLCVGAFYLLMLEFLRMNFAYYFYYHEDVMEYAALFVALALGAFHEYKPNWITNDVFALCSIFVVISRLQPVSFHSATAVLLGFLVFDLFWLYIIDLLSTVVKESKAPVMLIIPRDNQGHTQSLATLDIMVPGIFLNLVIKYSSMYDKALFNRSFVSLCLSLLVTTVFAIWRRKVTPAMVLPAIALISTSLLSTSQPHSLWKFMIKH